MLRPVRHRLPAGLALVVVVGLAALLSPALADIVADPQPAQREALAQAGRVQGAPDRTLVLSRVTVPPGTELALHHHLGTQVAHIASGVLRYTVRQGQVTVRKGEADRQPQTVRKIAAGQTAGLHPGEWIVEQPSDVHEAANRGPAPVVIYIATLLKSGAPPSTPVAPTALSSAPEFSK